MVSVKDLLKQFPFIYPAGIAQSCKNWIDKQNAKQGIYFGLRTHSYQLMEQAESHTHQLPVISNDNDANEFARNSYYQTSPAYLFNLKDIYIYKQTGLVISNRNVLFQDFTHNFIVTSLAKLIYKNPFYTFSNRVVRVNGVGAMLVSPQSQNYYHWLFDVLPRIKLYQSVLGHINHFCISGAVPQKFLDVLPAFGIPLNKILLVNDTEKLHFDNFYAASLPGSEGRSPKWAIDYVRGKLLSPSPVTANKKLYLKRGTAAGRKILNEESLIEALLKQGFDIITPDDLSIEDQAALFQQAAIVVSAHGAALSNLLFVREGTAVIEIFSPDYFRSDCYFTLSRLLNLDYHYIKGTKPDGADWGDIQVDETAVINLLAGVNG